jgi:ankyrin repeat protein
MRNAELLEILKQGVNNDDIEKVNLALGFGVKVNADFANKILFEVVGGKNNVQIFEILTQYGLKFKTTQDSAHSLLRACRNENLEMINQLLISGVSVNVRDKFTSSGNRLLMCAVGRKNNNIFNLILKYNPNLDDQDEYGETALMHAVNNGQLSMIKKLIEIGSNLNLQNSKGQTALMLAACKNQPEILSVLMASGANPNITNNKGDTPLMFVIEQSEMLKRMISNSTDLEITDIFGQTVLYLACHNGHYESVKILLDAGAQSEPRLEKSKHNKLPLAAASSQGHLDIVKLLIKFGVNINLQEDNGNTALFNATKNKKIEIVKYLLSIGADVNIKNSYQRTAIDVAIENQTTEISELLTTPP